MQPETIFILFLLLILKHFIADFILQFPYHYLNKGTYGHPGGINHALMHGIPSAYIIMAFVSIEAGAIAFFIDTVAHYHIDWAKMNINKKFNWKADTSEYFWWLLGVDQLLHYLTYAFIIYIVCF